MLQGGNPAAASCEDCNTPEGVLRGGKLIPEIISFSVPWSEMLRNYKPVLGNLKRC
jgi:hypothetical protein